MFVTFSRIGAWRRSSSSTNAPIAGPKSARPFGSTSRKEALAVECAKAATTYAAWALAEDADDAAISAAVAKATAGESYRHVTAKAIQLHGGIGFTWEHDLHVYYKRAMSGDVTFGDATCSREIVAERLGL